MGLIIVLVLAGIILLLLEFILPGMIAGMIGVGCLVASVIVGYTQFGATAGHLLLIGDLFIVIITGILWLRFFPHSPLGKVFVNESSIEDTGYHFETLLGKDGLTQSDLYPSGVALIEGVPYDVVSEGDFIEANIPIKVISVEGNRIMVRSTGPKLPPSETDQSLSTKK